MLTIQNLSVQFGGRVLFEDISFSIKDRDRLGLAGKNGAGKSTLMKIISGHDVPQQGQIVAPNGYSIGYLSQDIAAMFGKTVYEEAASAFDEIRALEKEMEEIGVQLTERTDYESKSYLKLLEQLTTNQERLDLLGAVSAEKEVETVLQGIGFQRSDFDRSVEEFSGGWQMRLELCKILLKRPSLILLDEPTNHLDIETIQWVEEFMKSYHGSLVVVSHDRAFLDNVTNRTIEISMGRIYDYKVPYSEYLVQREIRREQLASQKKNQDKQIEHQEKLIEKFKAKASKAKFAQSLIKKLDKVERIEIDNEDTSSIKFHFPTAPRSGKSVVLAKDLHKSYDDLKVLKGIDFEILRGEKIAFVGRNGEGKSTLSKLIVGQILKTAGDLELGYNVELGYFAQDQADKLDGNDTVFDVIDKAAAGEMRTKVRGLLGAFLFSGEDVDKKVKVLSGGEKSRLALARLLLDPFNLLVLDEPTNHLDLVSKAVLKESLSKFDGTVIVVSHDRDFLKGLTDRVFEFEGGKIIEHIGDIYNYLDAKKVENFRELEAKEKQKEVKSSKKEVVVKQESQLSQKEWFEAKKEAEKEEKQLMRRVEKHEREINALETRLAEIEIQLKDPSFFQNADPAVFTEYEKVKADLEQTMSSWEEDGALLEIASSKKKELHAVKPSK